jgi:hypothetical protein
MRTTSLLLPFLLLSAAPGAAQDVLRLREDGMGELSAADPTLEDGSHYDVWQFATQAGMRYAVYLLSQDFDESLAVGTRVDARCDGCVHATRAPDMPNTLVEITAGSDGMMRVRVSSARPGQTGRYIVAVHDESTFTPEALLRPQLPSVRAGQEVTGELVDAETQEASGDGRAGDQWRYSGKAGERLVVSMRSDDFDTILQVFACGSADEDEIAFDDDGGGGTNSRIEVTLPQDCEYEIRAGSLLRSEKGRYILRVDLLP